MGALGGNVSPTMVRNLSAALINAAMNGQDMGELNSLVDAQVADLERLRAENKPIYLQRIEEARKIIAAADKMDPTWQAIRAMADVQNMEQHAADQAERDIKVRQGGQFSSGQLKAHQRNSALHTARSKALAYGGAYRDAELRQQQLRGMGAGLLVGDAFDAELMAHQHDIQQAGLRARQEIGADTRGGFMAALGADFGTPENDDPNANDDRDSVFSFPGG